jgi:hypothetical protein
MLVHKCMYTDKNDKVPWTRHLNANEEETHAQGRGTRKLDFVVYESKSSSLPFRELVSKITHVTACITAEPEPDPNGTQPHALPQMNALPFLCF